MAAVVQDVESYQQLLERVELLESIVEIKKSIEEFEPRQGIPRKEAWKQFQDKYDLTD